MRVLVTGARGFVGQALVPALLARGDVVVATSRREPSSVPAKGVEWIHVSDSRIPFDWPRVLAGVDAVVHLAALVHVMDGATRPTEDDYEAINVRATRRLAEAAVAAGVRSFTFLSTAKVLGEGRDSPYRDDDAPAPADAYARSKRDAEDVLRDLAARSRTHFVTLRPPLVYGPGVGANFLAMMRAVDRRLPLPLASIRNRRSLVFSGNLVTAILAALDRAQSGYRGYLVSDGDDVSTPELLRRVGLALGKPALLLPFPVPLMRSMASIVGRGAAVQRLAGTFAIQPSSIAGDLDWRPRFTMEEGLAETAAWFRGVRS